MKKVLAVLLSVMMLFGGLSISSSAVADVPSSTSTELLQTLRTTGIVRADQVILSFDLQNGTIFGSALVYDVTTKKFSYQEGVVGIYNMIPDNSGSLTTNLQTPGRFVILPSVIAPEGKVFDGWYCYLNGRTYVANSRFEIPAGANVDPGVIEFAAVYSPAEVKGDIMQTILNVLVGLVAKAFEMLFPESDLDIAELLGGLF